MWLWRHHSVILQPELDLFQLKNRFSFTTSQTTKYFFSILTGFKNLICSCNFNAVPSPFYQTDPAGRFLFQKQILEKFLCCFDRSQCSQLRRRFRIHRYQKHFHHPKTSFMNFPYIKPPVRSVRASIVT